MTILLPHRTGRHALTVWLDPGPTGAPTALVQALQAAVHLAVVPRTGSRRVDVAVLLAPTAAGLELVRRLLPFARIIALGPEPAPPAVAAAARRERALLVPGDIAAGDLLRLVCAPLHVRTGVSDRQGV